ncbi:hypothetical protein BH11PLA2_BH11PLA2_51670 [soil metagenome]
MTTRHDPDRLEHAVRGAIDDLGQLLAEVRDRIGDKPEKLYIEAALLLAVQRFANEMRSHADMLR